MSAATATTSVPSVSDRMEVVLGYMQKPLLCPEDVKARIAALRIVAEDAPRPSWRTADAGPVPRAAVGGSVAFGGHAGGHAGGGGRGRGGHSGGHASHAGGHAGGHATGGWNSRPQYIRGGHAGGHASHAGSGHAGGGGHASHAGTGGLSRPPRGGFGFRRGGGHFSTAPRFGNRARADVTVEERMMDRIRDRMNKFCESTFDSTKKWLTELLDSGETDFLTGFITLVFDKAAEEAHICPLYAQLLTELRTAFPHLESELRRIFEEFMSVFHAAKADAAAGDDSVTKKRRQLRTGYAAFIGYIARSGVISQMDIFRTCETILTGLEGSLEEDAVAEEFAICLKTLVVGCKELLRSNSTEVYRLNASVEETRKSSRLTSNRARFALMDVEDALA